ncbi:TrkA C-terminal domain-containing protein [Roseivirga sp. BDSF3-8]|uniref:TrkA C-terminal domain-containing protein n=1 Tax=Roseivirga sp. BDSF3-8 TaxID=3241598 RepID=UPI003531D2FB
MIRTRRAINAVVKPVIELKNILFYMLSLISLILVIALSLLVTKVASIMLQHTGLSRPSAKFQARSAFTGVGFTTSEAESVVNHPVRRRIILTLMLLGNAGIITAVASLMLTLWNPGQENFGVGLRLLVLTGAIILLWLISHSKYFDQVMNRLINFALRRYTNLNVRDYSNLLKLAEGYGIGELYIEKKDWLNGKTMIEANLKGEGLNVLAIKRKNKDFVGTPEGTTTIMEGDTLILYGKSESIGRLDDRSNDIHGQIEHRAQLAKAKREAEQKEMVEKMAAEKMRENGNESSKSQKAEKENA